MVLSKIVRLMLAVCAVAVASGCATTGVGTRTGAAIISIYTEDQLATDNAGASKMGEACTMNVLGIYSGGDSSIDAAKKAGKISKVSTVDSKIFAILPFYGSKCTVVRGE